MYICDKCQTVFVDPAFIGEVHTELDDRPTEYFSCCPECGCLWFDEADLCRGCDEWIPKEEMYNNDYCNDCAERLGIIEY